MSYPKAKNEKMKKRDRVCKMCGTRKGLVRKYKIGICRRCFKDNAEKLGFKKYD
ncbi:MAG: 30S ribosomal protein S14 [Candidatus Diapherotrites archaeon]|jgi:ribosomal protein S14|nr:30S ribosomal protein S14 [Candidatus Diapherotrites archaeon]